VTVGCIAAAGAAPASNPAGTARGAAEPAARPCPRRRALSMNLTLLARGNCQIRVQFAFRWLPRGCPVVSRRFPGGFPAVAPHFLRSSSAVGQRSLNISRQFLSDFSVIPLWLPSGCPLDLRWVSGGPPPIPGARSAASRQLLDSFSQYFPSGLSEAAQNGSPFATYPQKRATLNGFKSDSSTLTVTSETKYALRKSGW